MLPLCEAFVRFAKYKNCSTAYWCNNSQCILKISCLQNFRKVWHCYRVVWHCCSVVCRIRIMTGVCSFPSQCSLRSIHSQGKLLRHDQTRSQQVFGRIFTLKCYKTRPPINSERWSIFFCLCSYLLVQHEGCWLLGISGSNPGKCIKISHSAPYGNLHYVLN